MISQILAGVEKKLEALLDMAVDATVEEGLLKTVIISTEHDPQVGIFGGPVFTLWWALYGKKPWGPMERKRWPAREQEEDFPGDVKIEKEAWEVPKEEWQDELGIILSNRKVIYDAMMQWYMRPY